MKRQVSYAAEVLPHAGSSTNPHRETLHILSEMGFTKCLVALRESLYKDQSALIRWNGRHISAFKNERGVRRGCNLSPYPFNLYSDSVIGGAEIEELGIKIDRHTCVHVCMCACVHVCMCACVHVCMCACVHVCMCACVHVCMCACVHACVHVSMYACVHV